MLKIKFSQTAAEEKWNLHGRLSGPWVHELRTCWKVNHRTDAARACIVDLNEVTFIDKSGERLLCMLARDGAQFTASGIYTNHVIEQLNVGRKRRLSNQLGCVIGLVLVATLGSGCDRRVASAPPPAPPTVEVTPVIQKDVPLEGEWVGTLEGYVNAQISPQVSGYLYHSEQFCFFGRLLLNVKKISLIREF
jgi:hypothetical protein